MQPADQQRLRDQYRLMADEALAELHLQGPEAYADPDGWRVLDEEYRARGSRASDARDTVLANVAVRAHITANLAPLFLRLVAGAVDLGVCLLIMTPFIIVGVSIEAGPTLDVIGLVVATLVYLPLAELKWHATAGKRVCGLVVVCEEPGQITMSTVAARAVARFPAWIALLTPTTVGRLDKQVVLLDDWFSGTRVVARHPATPPAA